MSRWPKRGSENRLEPECWPEITPKFPLTPGQTIFTIGSCFARHIDRELEALGFEVPMAQFMREKDLQIPTGANVLINKFNPALIYQEIAWVKEIAARGDPLNETDVLPYLVELSAGRFVDLHRPNVFDSGLTLEQAVTLRREFLELYKKLFTSDVCIITLGLTEGWYDRETQSYVEFSPAVFRHAKKDRFELRRMGFVETYDYLRRTIELINADGNMKVLITTSPIPFKGTFSDQDAIVANMQSKSTLRAVAGEIADAFDNVDYFPSYETVMLTRQNDIWEDDLVHVSEQFVAKIMSRVMRCYLPREDLLDAVPQDGHMTEEIGTLIKDENFSEACQKIEELKHPFDVPKAFQLQFAECYWMTGADQKALTHLEKWWEQSKDFAPTRAWFTAAGLFDELGQPDMAKKLMRAFVDEGGRVPRKIRTLLEQLDASGNDYSIDVLTKELAAQESRDLNIMLGRFYQARALKALRLGASDKALGYSEQANAFAPQVQVIANTFQALSENRMPDWLQKAVARG